VSATTLSTQSSSSLPKLSNLANLTTGAVARVAAGMTLMPLTVIKVRYESNLYAYTSIAEAAKAILKKEGIKGFFAGFGATAARDAPYAGLYVLFYEQLKKRLSMVAPALPGTLTTIVPSTEMTSSKSLSINFTSGVLAAAMATAITNPFDAVKTRLQLMPGRYGNLLRAAMQMVREEGVRSLFDGLALRMARKAMSSALAWTLYEELLRNAERRWK
jgi:solute carrier family 25 protein 38